MRDSQTYRYVVVGGGSAGCLVAKLLANLQSEPVALIEAGRRHGDVRCVVPNFYPRTFGSSLDWGYQTVEQEQLSGRSLAWPRGKLLGGCSAINALIYLQASDADYRRWGWKTEAHFAKPSAELPIGQVAEPHEWARVFLNAATQIGLEKKEAWVKSQADSCGLFQLTQQNGRRVHAGLDLDESATEGQDAFRSDSNLHIYTECSAKKLCIYRQQAVGVECMDKWGVPLRVRASQEVILCAGTIGSPMLLMQSGIGSADELTKHGIPCLVDSPQVGCNLKDHLVYPIVYRTQEALGLPQRFSANQRDDYRSRGSGPLASNIAEAGAIVSTNVDSLAQIHFTPTHYLKYPRTRDEPIFCSLAITPLNPRSHGSIKLASTTGNSNSIRIDPKYLSQPQDVVDFVAMVQELSERFESTELSKIVERQILPGKRWQNSDAIERSIRKLARTIYHPTSTCRTGDTIESSVVNRNYQVHGLERLRIADASVFPDLPSANPNAAVLDVARRLVAILL